MRMLNQKKGDGHEKSTIDHKYPLFRDGGAVHVFTIPAADRLNVKDLAYNQNADQRSWKHMQIFFEEILSE
jgi:dienelactone hydrolase